ncbi:hypothetical protein [Nonomuraea salmonea]|uniref:hypothetical protein n=1 Tax=Nonomuraea salmonea TaxID=46181 RepID=UPI0031E8F615
MNAMVSRREFLLANGTVLAAGALGLSLPAARAAASASAPLLPGFGRPTRLDYADIATLHGDDQLLLTTLQGVVNRRRPPGCTSTTTRRATTSAGCPAPAPPSPATTARSTSSPATAARCAARSCMTPASPTR